MALITSSHIHVCDLYGFAQSFCLRNERYITFEVLENLFMGDYHVLLPSGEFAAEFAEIKVKIVSTTNDQFGCRFKTFTRGRS